MSDKSGAHGARSTSFADQSDSADTAQSPEGRQLLPLAGAGLAIGRQLGSRYVIQSLLGRGAMGTVYLARDEVLGDPVALKFVASDPSGLGLLRDEVRLAQRVTHPNVCRTFDLVEADGLAFVKMEYVEGESLADVLDRTGKLPVADAERIARQIAAALGAAHARSVVHRDLKPANVLLEKDTGRVVVMDFGIARAASGAERSEVAGTPRYMAPEQVRGDAVDGRTDLYALGCVLYELLCGEPPFPGQTVPEVMKAHLESPVPEVRKVRPEVSVALEAVVGRLLAKDPAARFQSASEVERALAGPPPRRWPLVVAGLAFAAALATGATLAVGPRAEWRPNVRVHTPTFDENSNGLALSADGTEVVYGSDRELTGQFRLYLAPVAGGPGRALTPAPMNFADARFRRDKTSLLAWTLLDEKLYRLPLPSGPPEELAAGVFYAEECGGRLTAARNNIEGCVGCESIFAAGDDGKEQELVRASSATRIINYRCDREGRQMVWAAGPRGTFLGGVSDIWVVGVGPEGAMGPPRNLTNAAELDNGWPVFAADGKSVLFSSSRGGNTNLWEIPVEGGTPVQRTFGDGPDVGPDVSADGKLLAWTVDQTSVPIFVRPVGESLGRRLTAELENFQVLADAPQGPEVFGVATRKNKSLLVAASLADGSERVLAEATTVAMSVDRTTLYFAGVGAERKQVFSIPIGGGRPTAVATFPGSVQSMSVSEATLHASLSISGEREAWRVALAGGAPESDASPRWCKIIEAPTGGWKLAVSCQERLKLVSLVPPGKAVEDVEPTIRGVDFAWEGPKSFVYSTPAHTLMRRFVDGKEEQVAKLPPLLKLALSGDGKTLFYLSPFAHVRRQFANNFDQRPRPWAR